MKVLVVDDSSSMRRTIINILAQLGLNDVIQASDGKQAIQLTGDKEIGMILLDWNLPIIQGIDVLRRIRAAGNKVPVIMITTKGERANIIEAIRSGANNFVLKPFTSEVITAKIKEVLTTLDA